MLFHYLQDVWDLKHDCSREVYVCKLCILSTYVGFQLFGFHGLGGQGLRAQKLLLGLGLKMTDVHRLQYIRIISLLNSVCMSVCSCVGMYVCMYLCMYVCLYVCMYVCI